MACNSQHLMVIALSTHEWGNLGAERLKATLPWAPSIAMPVLLCTRAYVAARSGGLWYLGRSNPPNNTVLVSAGPLFSGSTFRFCGASRPQKTTT